MIVGLDEVGRGCWAGPLVAGAVILGASAEGLKDSKQLSAKRREVLDKEIRECAIGYSLGWVEPAEIDVLGMTASVGLAFRRALDTIASNYEQIIMDGNINYFPDDRRAQAIIKADATVPAVSAASIIAKVARDRFMTEAAAQFPGYGFERHVGYGTSEHVAALRLHGICALHRRSFKPVHTLGVR